MSIVVVGRKVTSDTWNGAIRRQQIVAVKWLYRRWSSKCPMWKDEVSVRIKVNG